MNITDGKAADNKGAYDIPLLKRSVIVSDRFYNDFFPAQCLGQQRGILRDKTIQYKSIRENELPQNRHGHKLIDEIIELTGTKSAQKYPKRLRRIAI